MRRLLMDSFEAFWNRYLSDGLRETLDSIDRSSNYIATIGGNSPRMRFVSLPGKEHEAWTTTDELYRLYKSQPELETQVPLIFCGTRHWGGIALRKVHFEKVGGYAPNFYGWGNEDTDLQWKLGECFRMEFFPDDEHYEVLHLDHEKPYFNDEIWQRNKIEAKTRKDGGVEIAIERDLEAIRRQGEPTDG